MFKHIIVALLHWALSVALSWLEAIKDYYGFNMYDIHKDNIMFRRTPVGMQLVFNDPFGYFP